MLGKNKSPDSISKIYKLVKEKNGLTLFIFAIACLVLFSPPVIINYLYWQGYKQGLAPNTMFSASDLLIFYASCLAFLGTVFLGIVTLLQNENLHQQNIRLENQRFIAEKAPILIPNGEKVDLRWNMSRHQHYCSSVANEVVLLDDSITDKSAFMNKLYGEIKLQTNENFVSEYKINNLKINFLTPKLHRSEINFVTEDKFKRADTFKYRQPFFKQKEKNQYNKEY